MKNNPANIHWLSTSIIPEITHRHHSPPLLIKDKDGYYVIGFYNRHEDPSRSGFYRTPNFTQQIEATSYIVALPDTLVKCGNHNCSQTVLIKDLVGSKYFPEINGQSFPCCPHCEHCLHFDFVSFNEEEE